MESTEIVASIPSYLEDELNVIAKNHQFLDYTIHVDNGSKHGDGFMATMIGVTLRGQLYHSGVKVNYELPLICKLLPESITRRGAIQQTIDVLEDKVEIEIMQRVKDNYETWIKEYLRSDAAGRFSVLNHGDLWNNNMMFKLDSNHQHRKLRFVDFQLLRLTSPVVDISYYVCTSTNPDIHQRFGDLLNVYYDSLATFVTKMGSDPQQLFTFNDMENQFRQFGKYGLIFSPILVGVLVSDSKDIIDMDTIKQDTKADGLAKLNVNTKVLLKERMSSAIQLAMKWGWI